jgi:hypothetical protein
MDYVSQPISLYRFHTAQMTRIGTQMTTATFAVLDKLYSQPDLDPTWQALRDPAYSQAYLRAAARLTTPRISTMRKTASKKQFTLTRF